MAQHVKTASGLVTAQKAWKTNRLRQQHQERPPINSISDALTITSVKPLCLRKSGYGLKTESHNPNTKLGHKVLKSPDKTETVKDHCLVREENQGVCLPARNESLKTSKQATFYGCSNLATIQHPRAQCSVPSCSTGSDKAQQIFPKPCGSGTVVSVPLYQSSTETESPGMAEAKTCYKNASVHRDLRRADVLTASQVCEGSVKNVAGAYSTPTCGKKRTGLGCARIKVLSLSLVTRQSQTSTKRQRKEETNLALDTLRPFVKPQPSKARHETKRNLMYTPGLSIAETLSCNSFASASLKPTASQLVVQGKRELLVKSVGQRSHAADKMDCFVEKQSVLNGTSNAFWKETTPKSSGDNGSRELVKALVDSETVLENLIDTNVYLEDQSNEKNIPENAEDMISIRDISADIKSGSEDPVNEKSIPGNRVDTDNIPNIQNTLDEDSVLQNNPPDMNNLPGNPMTRNSVSASDTLDIFEGVATKPILKVSSAKENSDESHVNTNRIPENPMDAKNTMGNSIGTNDIKTAISSQSSLEHVKEVEKDTVNSSGLKETIQTEESSLTQSVTSQNVGDVDKSMMDSTTANSGSLEPKPTIGAVTVDSKTETNINCSEDKNSNTFQLETTSDKTIGLDEADNNAAAKYAVTVDSNTETNSNCSEDKSSKRFQLKTADDERVGDGESNNSAPEHQLGSRQKRTQCTISTRPQVNRYAHSTSKTMTCSAKGDDRTPKQVLTKRAGFGCSQNLRRNSTKDKKQMEAKLKDDIYKQTQGSVGGCRVRSAQPNVFRSVARVSGKINQRRSKSVIGIACSKEPARGEARSLSTAASSGDAGPLAEKQVVWFTALWKQCLSKGTVDRVLPIMRRMPYHQRQQLVEVENSDSGPMLVAACMLGSVHMVNFMLDECGADIERKGMIIVPTYPADISFPASPLWCAAVSGHVEVVKTLIRHGADIGFKTSHGSTPLRSACFASQVDTVRVLIEAGADIHAPNHTGSTCLINSVHCPELVQLLLMQGAHPNDQDNAGNTALHYAAGEGHLKSVKYLIQFGGDCRHRNRNGVNVLQRCASRGWKHICDYVIQNTHAFKYIEVIEAYELLGCGFVETFDRYDMAVEQWRKALMLRSHLFPKSNMRLQKIAAYSYRLEFFSLDELDAIASDPDEIRMQSLLITERICGDTNRELTCLMLSRAGQYFAACLYRPCLELYKHAFHIQVTSLHPLSADLEYTACKCLGLILGCQGQLVNAEGREVACVSDCLEVLQLLVELLDKAKAALHLYLSTTHPDHCRCQVCDRGGTLYPRYVRCGCRHHTEKGQETYFILLMYALHLVRLMAEYQQLSASELHRFRSLVYHLIKAGHRTPAGDSLLHLCFPLCDLLGTGKLQMPTVPLLETLIACGADADALNDSGESPLFSIFFGSEETQKEMLSHPDREKWLGLLLKHDAHADRVSLSGKNLLQALEVENVCILNHVNLQCLAARAIKCHDVPYKDTYKLSPDLISFVEMH